MSEPATPETKKTRYQQDKERGPNPAIGLITCPICSFPNATVHQRRGVVNPKYFNCPQCGSIHCTKEKGQAFIRDNVRPLGSSSADKQEPKSVVKESSMLDHAMKFLIGD